MEIEKQLEKIASDQKSSLDNVRKELNDRIEAIDKGTASYEGQINELKGLVKEYGEKSGASQDHIDKLDARIKELKELGMSGNRAAETTIQGAMYKALNDSEDYKEFARSPRAHKGLVVDRMLTKAVGTMTFAASTTGDVAEQTRLAILPEVDRKNRIRQFIPQGVMTGDSVRFPKVTGGEGTAGNQTEGNAKSQIDKDLAEQTFNAQVIAAFARISTQMLGDIAGMTSYLSTELMRLLMNQEDSQLLTGTGATVNLYGLAADAATSSDLSTTANWAAPNNWDCITAAKAYLASQDFMADRVVLNPVDFYQMAGAKGTNGQYVSPVYFEADGTPRLFGMPVYHSTAVAEGSFFCWDSTAASQIFQREAPSIQFFPQDSDNAQKNLVTVRVEERLAHVRKHDKAVFTDTFANVKYIITPT